MTSKTIQKHLLWPFILVTSMFFMWGLANNMTDTLLAAFKKIMSMSDFQTSWIQVAFYGSYFVLALPAALLVQRFSYKFGLLTGLGLFIVGALLFYPASQTMVYGHFLGALFVLAGGLSILETTSNPYILDLGDESSAIKRLNLAQAFNPIGSVSGVLLSKYIILDNLNKADVEQRAKLTPIELEVIQREELSSVMTPYVGVAILLLVIWFIILASKMPTRQTEDHHFHLRSSLKALLQKKNYVSGVIAQFFYVGAQIGIWSYTIRYVMQEIQVNESQASNYYLAALVLFTVFRFGFTWMLSFFKAHALLIGSGMVAILLLLLSIFVGGKPGVYALVAVSGCMSLMFPTIFGLAVKGVGQHSKMAGSGLIMAILGGAVLTSIQGQVSDYTQSIQFSLFVPVACFAIIIAFGYISKRFA